jgi:hypothetical protein
MMEVYKKIQGHFKFMRHVYVLIIDSTTVRNKTWNKDNISNALLHKNQRKSIQKFHLLKEYSYFLFIILLYCMGSLIEIKFIRNIVIKKKVFLFNFKQKMIRKW